MLFPVHLDGHEVLVEDAGHLGIVEGFAGHDVTPVAGRVTDAEEDGFVLPTGLLQGFGSGYNGDILSRR